MAIGLCTSKLGGSVGPGRSFSAVNLPRDSIKTAMGSMERILLERAWKMLHPRENSTKGFCRPKSKPRPGSVLR